MQALIDALPYLIMVLFAGTGEYLKLLPTGSLLPVLTLAIGHFMGSTNSPLRNALVSNTQATQANTEAASPKGN